MQLSRVLTRAGKAMWLLLLVPLIAIGATTTYLWNAAPDVHTFATVSVIAPEGQSTAATVTQAVDGFKSAVVSETVAKLAAEDADGNLDISHDLQVERVGTSNLVEMRLTTQPGEDGNAMTRALVARTNDALFASTTASAEAAVSQAQENYDKAIADRDDAVQASGLLLPIESYRAKASEVTQLRVALAIGDSSVDRDAVQAKLTAAIKELNRIGGSVNSYENVQDQVIRSRGDLANANSELDSVETRQQAASADESITVSASEKQNSRTTMVRGAVAAAVVGLALGGGLVLLIGLLRGPRKSDKAGKLKSAA
jgi:hypothetical protein